MTPPLRLILDPTFILHVSQEYLVSVTVQRLTLGTAEASEVTRVLDKLVCPRLLLQLQPRNAELDKVHDSILDGEVVGVGGKTDLEHSVWVLRQMVPPPLLCVLMVRCANWTTFVTL